MLLSGIKKLIKHAGYLAFANLPAEIVFKRLCSMTVKKESQVRVRENFLVVSNHRSLVDSWMIISEVFNGRGRIGRYSYLPYHPAAVENFLDTPFKIFLFGRILKCLPVHRRSRVKDIFRTLDMMAEKLSGGTMIVFPEGTRTRDVRMIPKAKFGVGYLIYKTRPAVVPVYHNGSEKVLPVGGSRLSFGHNLYISVGKEIDLEAFYRMPDNKETWQAIADHTHNHLLDM